MAGFRTFATGEVLTAANVNNFLMGQSVMRFADATARTAALGTDVVEGMLTYNLATDQLEVFDGTNFVVAAPEPPAGIGSNVVQTVKTDVFTTTSASFVPITGFTASITPSSDTSKILVVIYASIGAGGIGANGATFIRVTGGNAGTFVGDGADARLRAAAENAQGSRSSTFAATVTFLDSPATASEVTYGVEMARTIGGTSKLNASGEDVENTNHSRTPSSITLIEVAA